MSFRHLGYSKAKDQEGGREARKFIDLMQNMLCGVDYGTFPEGVYLRLDRTSERPKTGVIVDYLPEVLGAREHVERCLTSTEKFWADARNAANHPIILARRKVEEEHSR